jgi:hypothetical protein
MTDDEVVQILCVYFESLFPKVCPTCNRCFATLREYLLITTPIGPPKSYNTEFIDWKTWQPVGSMAMANCPCGSTLALSTDQMELSLRRELFNWLMTETQHRGVKESDLLEYLRDRVRKRVLGDPIPGDI